jgi:6-pyruvoyltetrahydropterin/6-carboxytetrahydropterin synthase
MPYQTKIELFKEDMKFSAGHFTVFSATERERLHGHNFYVQASLTMLVEHNGMAADYNLFKNKLRFLCNSLDEFFLLPAQSPYLLIEEKESDGKLLAKHAKDELLFYLKDVKLLPLQNITVEELSKYFAEQILEDTKLIKECKITELEVKISSGYGQWGCYKVQTNL